MNDKEEIRKRTLAKMFAGAQAEEKRFQELKEARKKLKMQLEVSC